MTALDLLSREDSLRAECGCVIERKGQPDPETGAVKGMGVLKACALHGRVEQLKDLLFRTRSLLEKAINADDCSHEGVSSDEWWEDAETLVAESWEALYGPAPTVTVQASVPAKVEGGA